MQFKPLVSLSYEFFFTIANTIILFFVLKRLLFKPVLKVIDDRDQEIKKKIDDGNKALEEGLEFKEEYEEKLDQIKNQGQEILEKSKKMADERAEKIILEARNEASAIKEKASLDIEKERQQAYEDVKGDISEIAILAASKVIEKDIDTDKHKELIDEFIKEVGDVR